MQILLYSEPLTTTAQSFGSDVAALVRAGNARRTPQANNILCCLYSSRTASNYADSFRDDRSIPASLLSGSAGGFWCKAVPPWSSAHDALSSAQIRSSVFRAQLTWP